jgi:hypothetical protein
MFFILKNTSGRTTAISRFRRQCLRTGRRHLRAGKSQNPKKLKITQNFTKSLSKHLFTCFKHKLILKNAKSKYNKFKPKNIIFFTFFLLLLMCGGDCLKMVVNECWDEGNENEVSVIDFLFVIPFLFLFFCFLSSLCLFYFVMGCWKGW